MTDAKLYDIAIIGGGMAGLTAAIYAARANKSVVLFERKVYGGQILTSMKVSNYPGESGISGYELMKKVYEQAKKYDVVFVDEDVISIKDDKNKELKTEDEIFYAKTVIIATGTKDRELDIPGEKEFLGHGLSYCATCDGAFYMDKPVAVVGGGNTALYDALYLADIASKVYLIHRRDEFRGDAHLVEKLREKKNVEFVMESRPNKLLGDKKISGIEVIDTAGEKKTLDVDGVFVAIGRVPATEQFKDIVKLDKDGYIVAGEDCHTSAEGIFVAGDCRTKTLRQLVTASSDGAMAATEAVHYLK